MPYIEQRNRKEFDQIIEQFPRLLEAGELNYIITKLAHRLVVSEGKRYAVLNGIMGVFECVKQEFYRRVVAPYEDQKIKENGDV